LIHYLGTVKRKKISYFRFLNLFNHQVVEVAKVNENKDLGIAAKSARDYYRN